MSPYISSSYWGSNVFISEMRWECKLWAKKSPLKFVATQEIDPVTFLYWLTTDKIATLTSAQLYLVTLVQVLNNHAGGKLKAYVYNNQSSDQYTIFKEGGPGFTKYTVFTGNRRSRLNDKEYSHPKPLARHKSLPPKERRKSQGRFLKNHGKSKILY